MTVLTSRPAIGADVTIMIDGTDRTSWIQSFSPDDSLPTDNVRPLGQTREQMIHTGESTTISCDVLSIPEARRYFVAWKNTLNDQRAIVFSPDGTGTGATQTTYQCLVTNVGGTASQGERQTITVSLHANNVTEGTH